MSDSSTSMSALVICATRAASRSLSPKRISAVAIVSFSLTTGTAPSPSSWAKVARAFKCRRRSSVSSKVSRIWATVIAVAGQRLLIGVGEADLPGGRGRLFFLEPEPVSGEAQMPAADRDRTGGDEDHLLAPGAAARDIVRQCVEPPVPDLAAVGDQQGRADLDDQPPRRSQRLGGSGGAGVSPAERPGSRSAVTLRARGTPPPPSRHARAASAANSAASTSGTPAPETPDNGITAAPRPAARRSWRIFASTVSASSASILLSPTISGLSARPWP